MNSHNIPESEITKGAKIELEHEKTFKKYLGDNCDIVAICRDIAIDHLEINPNAYKESFVGDVVAMNVPLYIRTLELAREDIKSDADLHRFVEKVITASKNGKVLTMDDYEKILIDSLKEKSFSNGGLVAPNGKPSNLTPEQYKLVRTPEFKAWFGDWENDPENASKVVDSNGEPMIVWHTTSVEFNIFNKKKSKDGFFFSPQKERLSVYGKSKINSYFLNLRNPSHEIFESDLKYLSSKDYDGIMDYGHARHLGNENLYEIIAFEPNQIKLADGSNTTFDANNDDIRFDEGGSVEYPLESKDLWYGDSDYENRGGKMIMMSPEEYIKSVRPLDIDEASRDNIDDLKQHILSGRKLDPLTIQKDGKEDGRHRAYAALELGIKEVPVIIFKDGGKIQLNSNRGKVNLNLEKNWKEDTELVPISELLKFREFDRLATPKYNYEDSENNINNLEKLLLENGVQEPLIIEYSQEDKAVLLIEGNHRLNVADKLGFDYLPARVVLRRRPFQQQQKMKSLKVKGFKPDEYGYVPSNLKPSQVGIKGTIKAFEEGGIIEGQLHSECNENTGCGEKFDVGNSGHIIEAERDEAVIVSSAFKDDNKYEIKGTLSQIASALNVIGGGKNFDSGAEIKFEDGKVFEVSEIKQEAKNTDVETIDPNSIIINRRSMYDKNIYLAKGTPKEIASQINNINGNGVKIIDGGSIHKIQ